jgi:hypothetical protein
VLSICARVAPKVACESSFDACSSVAAAAGGGGGEEGGGGGFGAGTGGVGAGGVGAGGAPGGGALAKGGAPASPCSSLPPQAARAVAANKAPSDVTSRDRVVPSAVRGGDSTGSAPGAACTPDAGAGFSLFIDCSLPGIGVLPAVTQSTLSSRRAGRFVSV